jgi:hypothetical protein
MLPRWRKDYREGIFDKQKKNGKSIKDQECINRLHEIVLGF